MKFEFNAKSIDRLYKHHINVAKYMVHVPFSPSSFMLLLYAELISVSSFMRAVCL